MLHCRNTNACGTVKQKRKRMPDLKQKIKKGEILYNSTKNLLALKWMDKREVRMLSTCHSPQMLPTGKTKRDTNEEILKPECVIDYNITTWLP
jgi:hypothetical protein